MTTTFINQNTEKDIQIKGKKYLESVQEDLIFFQYFDAENEDDFLARLNDNWREIDSLEKLKKVIDQHESLGNFNEYGLSFETQNPTHKKEGYFRFLISWGGPSAEVRFYGNRTEFVYLDWFCGVGFDVSQENGFKWLREWFDGAGMLNFDNMEIEEDSEEKE